MKTVPMATPKKRGRRPKAPTPFTKNFAHLLKEKGCTHRHAAEIAGLAPSVISGWTAGSIPHDLKALLKITETLNADFQFILTGVSSNSIPPSRIHELFEAEIHPELTGLFMVEVKRLRKRKGSDS
ncbi:MAG: hypothetical protein ACXWQO_11440 [Bdellovibrionota bacterium]